MMSYVINTKRGYVSHQGSPASCREYVANAKYLFGIDGMVIVEGAKARDAILKTLKK